LIKLFLAHLKKTVLAHLKKTVLAHFSGMILTLSPYRQAHDCVDFSP
jgi:hypothetical protein